jgi:hypothetical protein
MLGSLYRKKTNTSHPDEPAKAAATTAGAGSAGNDAQGSSHPTGYMHVYEAKQPAPVSSSRDGHHAMNSYVYEQLSSIVKKNLPGPAAGSSAAHARAAEDSDEEQEQMEMLETVELDKVLYQNFWHWRELAESRVYELYLLRWETRLQRQLGDSITAMIASLSSSAVQVCNSTIVYQQSHELSSLRD